MKIRYGTVDTKIVVKVLNATEDKKSKDIEYIAQPKSKVEKWNVYTNKEDGKTLGHTILSRLLSKQVKGDVSVVMSDDHIDTVGAGIIEASYKFDKYKTNKKNDKDFDVCFANQTKEQFKYVLSVLSGVNLAKDLVNETPNNLYPKSLAKKAKDELSSLGITVKILGEKQMTKLGMGSLLAVGQGSARESQLVVMEYSHKSMRKQKPIALVGKGVTFDSGGYNLKPGAYMTDMKSDMGGSAVVIGTMKALALTKAKAHVVGVIGSVENMVSSNAFRPDDVVTSMSGQTIEVTNTDAEGRMVLADVLHYTNTKYKPSVMIDLATLTGAVSVALADRYAAMFTHCNDLRKSLKRAGKRSGDELWSLPLDKIGGEWDKAIDSKVADMQNSIRGIPGSTEGAQFLQRFVGDTKWAHLDIAGVTLSEKGSGKGFATGYGVKLLLEYIKKA